MQEFETLSKDKQVILALGAESSGNFSAFKDGKIYFSEDFNDLQEITSFQNYKRELNKFLKRHAIIPDVILSDLHPLFSTTQLAKDFAKKHKAEHVPVQHHLAHIFSAVGDEFIHNTLYKIHDTIIGVACDGTGFGFDEKIWGGEVFKISNFQFPPQRDKPGAKISNKIQKSKIEIDRIGHLENQMLIGGEMAINEPARMLISILAKITRYKLQIPNKSKIKKSKTSSSAERSQEYFVYDFVKKYYSENEFEVLWNQLNQDFNCLETSSTARVLDAVSVLLGFSKNERSGKHGPIKLLEENSTKPYSLKPIVEFNENKKIWIIKTTPLFKYLIKNLHKDKGRLAATAQKYIADGLIEIISQCHPEFISRSGSGEILKRVQHDSVFFAGGMANNKIISQIFEKEGVYMNKKIPRGDAGISVGQIFYYLLANPGD